MNSIQNFGKKQISGTKNGRKNLIKSRSCGDKLRKREKRHFKTVILPVEYFLIKNFRSYM